MEGDWVLRLSAHHARSSGSRNRPIRGYVGHQGSLLPSPLNDFWNGPGGSFVLLLRTDLREGDDPRDRERYFCRSRRIPRIPKRSASGIFNYEHREAGGLFVSLLSTGSWDGGVLARRLNPTRLLTTIPLQVLYCRLLPPYQHRWSLVRPKPINLAQGGILPGNSAQLVWSAMIEVGYLAPATLTD